MATNILNTPRDTTFQMMIEKLDVMNANLGAIAANGAGNAPTNGLGIRNVVRSGNASKLYRRGDVITCGKKVGDVETRIEWTVLGIDQEEGYEHSLTLAMSDIYIKAFPFDVSEMLYYTEAALPAGTYNVMLNHGANDGSTVQDGSYQFTTTQTIPAGGGIRHTTMGQWSGNGYTKAAITGGKFFTYDASGNQIEGNLATTEGSGGTNLGTFTARDPQYRTNNNCNFTQRNAYGSNNYEESDILLWANSDKQSWWHKVSKFDLPHSQKATPGFMCGLDTDFLDALAPVTKKWEKSTSDGGGIGEVTSKFFLLGKKEVYGSGSDGTIVYDYFKDFSDLTTAGNGADTNRIKYAPDGTAHYWWLRSAYSGRANHVWSCYPSGAVTNHTAGDGIGAVLACVIA